MMKSEIYLSTARQALATYQRGLPVLASLRQALRDAGTIDRQGERLRAALDTCFLLIGVGGHIGLRYAGDAGRLVTDPAAFCSEINRRLHGQDHLGVDALLQTLSGFLEQARAYLPVDHLELPRAWLEDPAPMPAPPPPDPEPAAPQVVKVEIVAMPERLTQSVIDRDGAGNIKQTMQIERDAA